MCEEMKTMENEAPETGAGRNKISRYKMREQAFFLCFESLFSDTEIDELADNAGDARDELMSDYAILCAKGVREHGEEIDKKIADHLKSGWKLSRMEDVPVSVSINEAVELSKKYTVQDDTSFINGVLGAIAKEL